MPLFEKARIEVYIPDLPAKVYQDLLQTLDQEFTYTFGGCTIIRGLEGSYLSKSNLIMQDRINLVYTDMAIAFDNNFVAISDYTDHLRMATFEALAEEAVLVVASKVYHSE